VTRHYFGAHIALKEASIFQCGYMGKLPRVNLSTRQSFVETIDPEEFRLLLGARGLGALWYWREIGPEVKPPWPPSSPPTKCATTWAWTPYMQSFQVERQADQTPFPRCALPVRLPACAYTQASVSACAYTQTGTRTNRAGNSFNQKINWV
jgi:hypothetical protein